MTRRLPLLAALAATTLVAGCAGIRDHRGYVMDKTLANAIQPGVDNKDSVEKTLGRPTFGGQFGDSDWYYLSRSTSALAFRTPQVTSQDLLHIRFDAAGNVASVNHSGKEQIAAIRPLRKSTPTLGRKRSFFDEIFGNIGMVGSGGLGGSGSAGGQPGGDQGQ
ncbi:MAG: outer membrane protein assembly factor BamE [Pseudomonadota bacterium]|jgi:outer membrane protein assembly factor BamE (lipoprotein component of BamABCDE complex)|nr:outer membrane protein assembly factor BamE [Pseudomonadota bacterium]